MPGLSYESSGVNYDQLDAFKRACQQAAAGEAAEHRRRVDHHSGKRSRSQTVSIGWRSRIADQLPASTHTSAARGRAL